MFHVVEQNVILFQVGISNRHEDLICAKLNAFWYYISLFGPLIHKKTDEVIVPFLKFCFGTPDSQISQVRVVDLIWICNSKQFNLG